ncbi:ABC transporter permease [Jeotgalibaca caeni]|uniref:ABC transporter permease n=1 Tax=Jeotgalibaca caeni TaxID=3028623 RepID=UPI00237E01AF|nr:iron chelate uptake ABC transporter family permease subunit [Jeotgalibaca caeni]MDE1547917.1 iron chelate uptake ABC transporter family permease subunit [Jeotgalibaca caeni]
MRKIFGISLCVLVIFLSLHIGSTPLSWKNIWSGEGNDLFILWSARIPRTITVLLAGAGLSLAGLVMQTLTQNRFAAPDTIGTVESAKLGMLVAMIVLPNLSVVGEMMFTFLFASLGTLLFLFVSSKFPMKNQMLIPLLGVMYGNIIGGFGNFLAYRYDVLQNMSAWLQGNFSLVIEGQYEWIYLTFFLIIGLYFFADYLTVARFGKEAAQSLGLPFEWVMAIGTVLVSITVSVILIVAGNLPFLGVIIPNLIAMRYGDYLRSTHQKIAFTGAMFLLVCDLLSRTLIRPYEIPVELILGIVAGTIFLVMLFRRVKAHE